MKATKLVMLLFFCFQIVCVPTARAYEAEMHYGWTYYLALQVGFNERQAYQIASAADSIDWDDQTNPVASPLSTPVDTIYGGERFRYFDKELNEIWRELAHELKNSGPLSESEPETFTTLQKLRKANRENYRKGDSPNKKLWTLWRKYYGALVARNPAVRTWVQIHAFQPATLQRPRHNLAKIDDFVISDQGIETIDLTDAGHYWFRRASHFGFFSKALPTPEKNPGPDKNSKFGILDSIVNEEITNITSFCGNAETLASCIEIKCKKLEQLIEETNSFAKPVQVFVPRTLSCREKIDTRSTLNWLDNLESEAEATVKQAQKKLWDRPFSDAFELEEYRKILISSIESVLVAAQNMNNLLRYIAAIQRVTGMSGPKIYDAIVSDIDRSVIDFYFRPRDPRDNATLKHATLAVNNVRGEVVQQLTDLWHTDRNPGPILHYIQDLQPHGSYNTYHGHAMVNHVPDFIIYDLKNAERATIDSTIILCEFKEWLDKHFPVKESDDSKKRFFSARVQHRSWLCEAAEIDRNRDDGTTPASELAVRLPLDKEGNGNTTLLSILEDVGSKSTVPAVQFSHVTQQGLDIQLPMLAGSPAHQPNKNSTLGLPDLDLALSTLDEYISDQYIPIWREQYHDLGKQLESYLPRPQGGYEREAYDGKFLRGKYQLSRSKLPHGFLQYDFDYCGRVLIADRGLTKKGLPTWKVDTNSGQSIPDLKAVTPCINTKALNATSIETDVAVNDVYSVETIKINIDQIKMNAGYRGKLSYTVSGVLPELNGGKRLEMSLPKRVQSGPIEQFWLGPDKEGTDMFKTEAVPPIGPGYLPVYENCQVIIPNSEQANKELEEIIDKKLDPYLASTITIEYLTGKKEAHYRGLVRSGVRKIEIGEDYSVSANLRDLTTQKPSDPTLPTYVACVIHARSLPPTVALHKASYQVKGETSNPKKGK